MAENLIEVDFNQAYSDANRLSEIASEIKSLADNEIENSYDVVSMGWKSEHASQYLSKSVSKQETIRKISDNVGNVAKDYKNAIKKMQAADDLAKNMGLFRSYH